MTPREHQKGVALLVVLLLLATLSVLAVAMTATLRIAMARTGSAESLDQIRWYAAGAEGLAVNLLQQQWAADPAHDTQEEEWLQGPVAFPFDNGIMQVELSDATLCFNLNSLVTRDSTELIENPEARAEFMALMKALGYDSVAQGAVSKVVTDWMDTDAGAGPDGAEDPDYARLDVPYRTAGTTIADISELRAIMWMTPELYTSLRPWLCAQPDRSPSPINVNMISPRHEPLLQAAFADILDQSEITALTGQIPREGFSQIDQFWALPVFDGKQLTDDLKKRFRLYSSFLRMRAEVNYNQAFILQQSLLEVSDNGAVRVIARKTGPDA